MSLTDAQEIDQLKSRNEIAELFADYAHGCDKRQSPDRFLAIWHDDAKYLLGKPMGDRFGIEEIRQALKDIWEATDESHHWITNVVVRFSGPDTAQGDADTICHCKLADGPEVLVSGSYDVEFERRDGRWKIAVCDLQVHWQKVIDLKQPEVEAA
jgi:gamma-hexachlorocyclohexane dehydrochlorinase